MEYKLGDMKSSEQLIKDLYIELRKRVNLWADITKQTPQARMGYVGQHLTSVVTGFPGGKSGARGYDIILNYSPLEYGEIKTCYRVDQLGTCNNCNSVVSSIEKSCSVCNSTNIKRNDDSKWLISIKDEQDLKKCFLPKYYYFVLFEYENIHDKNNLNIQASIWQVDSQNIGFKYCLIDYYYNIKGTAPLNIWPYQLKFHLFNPQLIYRSIIKEDDSIDTQIFPGVERDYQFSFPTLKNFYRSKNLTDVALKHLTDAFCINHSNSITRVELIDRIEQYRNYNSIEDERFINTLAEGIYLPLISRFI